MSTQWSGGKGDRSRVANYRMYTANYDNIFGVKAVAKRDIWGEIDIIEGDTIMYNREGDRFRIVVISEAPFKFGEASGNAGKPFYVTKTVFEEKYKQNLLDK